MEAQELQERIARFSYWHYRFEFDGGVATPVYDRGQLNRHEQRRRYFFDALLALAGGTLAGRRVLDLGCNAGFWSLAAIDAGAEFVLGIDAREEFIEQAELVFEAKRIERARYRFERANVFDAELDGSFDVVLCLGLIEQVAKPVELFELMRGAGAELIVIDTAVSRARSSSFELGRLSDPRRVLEHEIVLIPSRQAVLDLAREFGFRAVPLALETSDWRGMDDYRSNRRLAFICSKGVPLDSVRAAQRPGAASSLAALARAARARGPRR